MDSLLVLNECRSALSEAKTLDDVLAIRDKAEMVRKAREVLGASRAAQNEAVLVKVQAEVMLGDAMSRMEKRNGARDGKTGLHDGTPLLSELGITKAKSHRWQTIAKAKKRIEALYDAANEADEDFSSALVYRAGKKLMQGDKPAKPSKANWGAGEWIAHLRKTVEKIYDEAPAEFREIMANVLRSHADEVESWESSDGSSRGVGKAEAVGA